ncbi:MAG: Phosphoglycolate phosphatase [Firmicutes bacterium]|nr:Phosphoglycolate phosphatase [Bacillota bacterium]MBT9158434.1 Phosphoglycolate phosphatase [Bacillota bacterium]
MPSLLLPKLYVESIFCLDLEKLKALGIDTIITDLDNTLVPWVEHEANPTLLAWLKELRARGFKVCLVSNALEQRIAHFRQVLGIPGLSKANKPSRRAFLQALDLLGSRPEQAAMIGDQVFTDVLGGNRLGLYTILVVPLCRREFLGTRVLRLVERVILRNLVLQK